MKKKAKVETEAKTETKAFIKKLEDFLKKNPESFNEVKQALIDINEKIKTGVSK